MGGTLQLDGASAVTANRSLDLRGAATVAVADPAGVLTVSGVIAQSGGTYGLAKAGPGTLVPTGSSSYTGATIVSAGTLQLGDGTAGHDGSLATGGITNNATLA
jgi:autotransporter-associated beta strand protein